MRIGELARRTATAAETIRYYEREGLLPDAPRTAANYRIYDQACADRLEFIRNCRNLDMSLDEIRALLRHRDAPLEPCHNVNALLDAHIDHVVERIQSLRQLEKQLRELRERCADDGKVEQCGILVGLGRAAARPVDRKRRKHGSLDSVHEGGFEAGRRARPA